MKNQDLNILYEDKYLLALFKEPGMAVQTARLGETDLYSAAMNYVSAGGKRREVFIINRLDQPVSGIVLMAKTGDAAAKLSRQLADGTMEKYYRAVCFGVPDNREDTLVDYISRQPGSNLSCIVPSPAKGSREAKRAVLKYTVEAVDDGHATLGIKLVTGRHHQIRVQMAHVGHPLLGDLKYGNEASIEYSRTHNINNVALTATELKLIHPIENKAIKIVSSYGSCMLY